MAPRAASESWVDESQLGSSSQSHHACVTALPRVGVVSASLVGIQGSLKCKHGLAVAGVPLLSHCLIPLSVKALLQIHTQINLGVALG